MNNSGELIQQTLRSTAMKSEKYFISVGEPWDYESQDGQNLIRGNILSVKSNRCLVFKSNYNLIIGKYQGNVLVLTPRYKDEEISELQNELVVVNGSLLLKEYSAELSERELQEYSRFVIIGSIRKE